MKSVCVIGGGVGGLMTGALLAKEGFMVTVLEKNRTVGGGLQCFSRRGYLFDPGMHVFGGMQKGGNLRTILEYLGVADHLHFEPCSDTLVHDGEIISLGCGRDAWIESIGGGQHRSELEAYVDALYRLADTEDLFNLREESGERKAENISAKELVEHYISDHELRKRVAYVTHLYDGAADSPALLHALTSVLHIDGCHTLLPSAHTLAEALCNTIAAAGGEVHSSCDVTAIEAEGREVKAVICGTERFSADHYVSAIGIGALLRIAPREAFSTAFRSRIKATSMCCSAFSVYGILKPHTVLHRDTGYHVLRRGASAWDMANVTADEWPHNLFLMTTADKDDPRYAATFTLVAPMNYSNVQRWEESTAGHRPADYREWKQQMAERAILLAEEAIGPIETEYIETASPLTLRDYNGTTCGSCYGLHPSVLTPELTTLSPRTRMSNLYLTGQDVNFHGMVGTSLTAVLTAESIVGTNTIVKKTHNTIWKQ